MQRNKQNIERATFKAYAAVVTASNIVTVPLNSVGLANPSTRFAAMLDLYGLYRLTKFNFRILKGTNEVQSAAVIANFQDATPSSPAKIFEAIHSQAYMIGETARLPFVKVPKAVLAGALPWYKSIPGSIDSWEEIPASLVGYTDAVAGTILLELEWEAEFKDQLPPAATPAVRSARLQNARDIARSKLLNVVAGRPEPTQSAICVFGAVASRSSQKPPSAPARSENEQTRPFSTPGNPDLGSKALNAQYASVMDTGC
jgi:hypothetical protein